MDVSNLILIGQVSSIDPDTGKARVAFDDLDEMTSTWLPVTQQGTAGMQTHSPLTVGEHVLCIFLPSGMENGFIIGGYYTESNRPEYKGAGIYSTSYSDGTVIQYDLNESKLTVTAVGDITINAGGAINISSDTSIRLSAPVVDIN